MKYTSRAIATMALTAAAALLISGCTGGTGGGGDSASQTLDIGVSADIVETIPSAIAQFNTRSIMSNMYDQIVAEPESGTEVTPMLATDWTVSDDQLTYTFTIRDGVTFHNGDALTAKDVAWSLEHARNDPNTAGDLGNVEKFEATDESTVVATMIRPQPDLLMTLSDPGMGIMPAEFGGASEDEFRAAPVGSGPFAFKGRTVGTDIEFTRFDDYWGDVAKVAGLHFKVFPDVNAESIALQSGDIDIASNVPLDSVSLMQGTAIETAPQIVEILQLNSNTGIIQNADFRKALSLGMDRSGIVDNLVGGFGEAATSNLSTSAFPEGAPDIPDSPYTFDTAAAKDLVAASGYDGTPLRLIYSTGIPTDVAIATALQAQWKEAGIEIALTPLESGEWLKAVTAPSPHDNFDLSISRAGGATATPQLGFLSGSQYYGGGWPTDDVEAASVAYAESADSAAAQQALADYEVQQSTELKTIPIAYLSVVWITSAKVSGLEPRESQYIPLNTAELG